MSSVAQSCTCTGIRFCAKCHASARVQQLFHGTVPLSAPGAVIEKQNERERLSSCSFATVGRSTLSCCIECMQVFESQQPLKACDDHCGADATELRISGLFVIQNGLSAEDEAALLHFLDHPAPFPAWKDSQSGRRKQDYGPRRNFKKKKVKPAEVPAMPRAFEPVFAAVSRATEQCTGKPYTVAEVSALEYLQGNMSNFDPHVDDTWLWGDRIAGLNLNEPCVMTFVNQAGVCCDVHFPRRAFFVMSGACRYHWMHGIRPEHVRGRRVSLTFRELSDEILSDRAAAEMVLLAASTFLA